MNAGRVERIVTAPDPQEASALFKCLRAQSWNIEQRFAAPERAGLIAMAPSLPRASKPDTRDSSGTEAVLRSTPTAFTASSTTAFRLRASVPARRRAGIADTDRLRFDLHQFGQRILEPPRVDTAPRSVTSRSGSSCAA